MAPIPAVSAIAKAPQKVSRAVALRTFAPALAPITPRRARKPKDAAETIVIVGCDTSKNNPRDRLSGAALGLCL